MALDIVVRRDPCGPYKHEDVTEPLLGSNVEAGISLGESILDEEGTGLQSVEYRIIYHPELYCGMLVKVFDVIADAWVYGKIVSVEHSGQRESGNSVVLMTTLKLLCPTKFFSVSL